MGVRTDMAMSVILSIRRWRQGIAVSLSLAASCKFNHIFHTARVSEKAERCVLFLVARGDELGMWSRARHMPCRGAPGVLPK